MPASAGDPADKATHHQDPMPGSPVDRDLEVVDRHTGPALPPHLRPGYLGAVATGGAVGAVVRYLITEGIAPVLSQPVITVIINLAGCLLLGVLLEALAFRGPDQGVRRTLRLLLGTGVLGGFTTYSTLAVDAAIFISDGHLWRALGYGLGTVVLGVLAAGLGVWLALITHRRYPTAGVQR